MSFQYYISVIFSLVLFSFCWCDKHPFVDTVYGRVNGFHMKTVKDREILAFTSIPYAEPPVGQLRFQHPHPMRAWSQPVNATVITPLCIQRNPYTREADIVGQEDCLYLNIYTPYTSNDLLGRNFKPLPVMVFIHGGGLMCLGSRIDYFGPEYLLDKDVLLVTINYRLGPLGFLSTQDENCPGNNGLKDQREALRFVQRVIESFGGDRGAVTIFGESAGGASVHYHMLSYSSQGLFHRAISESGTAFVPWAEAHTSEPLKNALRLADFLDCPKEPRESMMKCLRSKDAYDIIGTEYKFYSWDYEPMTPFKAVVEPPNPEAFITESPRIRRPPAVPWMTGTNKDEGCLKSVWITSNSTRFKEFIYDFDTISPVTFYYENSPVKDKITQRIKDFYLNTADEEHLKQKVLEMYSDSYFDFPAVEAVDMTFNYTKNPIYLYQLTYRATNSFSQVFGDPAGDYGVCHADELMHLFPVYFLTNPISKTDLEVRELILTLWVNFATSGDPNQPQGLPFTWKQSEPKQLEYLEIDTPRTSSMKTNLGSRSRFWGTLPDWRQSFTARSIVDEL